MHNGLEVDNEKCVACGMCAAVYPDVFDEDLLGYAYIRKELGSVTINKTLLNDVMRTCPGHAIKTKSIFI